ncbi:TetR/AcrR family transcriptional regulator [Streptomyces carpinensis]|uniref:Helix-turn-helix domain-containing protein n=1 Tax=Streptomyces carpinensis TaxID=66369 RepID=A0ABV1W098_9ACTN|nr:helix-turn-helix domain-containing protein [Streptomyces carpinensis]
MASQTGMGLRERKKLATWQAIRSAALQLIDQHDFDSVSLEEIAEAAGVSRTTLFNYFTSKEAIVLDPAPRDPELWRSLMDERPEDEALWTSLQAIYLGYLATFSDRLGVQKRLKAVSPTLAASSREHAARFKSELRDWAANRVPSGCELRLELALHTAEAATAAAYTLWAPDDGFDRLMELAQTCFEQAGRGFAHP